MAIIYRGKDAPATCDEVCHSSISGRLECLAWKCFLEAILGMLAPWSVLGQSLPQRRQIFDVTTGCQNREPALVLVRRENLRKLQRCYSELCLGAVVYLLHALAEESKNVFNTLKSEPWSL